MRRSQAPSQRCLPPTDVGQTKRVRSENEPISTTKAKIAKKERSADDILQLLQSPPSKAKELIVKKEIKNDQSASSGPSTAASEDRCYSVVWCKPSKRKHKIWEGDGTLQITGKVAVLIQDGKEISRSTGLKIKDLDQFEDGFTFPLGGREIQIVSRLPNGGETNAPSSAQSASSSSAKAPLSTVQKAKGPARKGGRGTSLFDPNAANAFTLPRPNDEHEVPVVDVVVDPYIASHLREHQRDGVRFLYECVMGFKRSDCLGAILADEMGLGKTLQCISLIWTLLKQGPYGGRPVMKRCLIVTPSSLVLNWQKEFQKWLGTERIQVYYAQQKNRAEEFANYQTKQVLVLSYEMFVQCYEALRTLEFGLIVCDEGHRLKNATTKANLMLSSLDCPRRIVITGTPVQNQLTELFALMDFCNPGLLGTQASFRAQFEHVIVRARELDGTDEERMDGEAKIVELNQLIAPFLLRRGNEVIQKYLPPKVEVTVFCRLSDEQRSRYVVLLESQEVQRCLQEQLAASTDSAAVLTHIQNLKKLCNHPCLMKRQEGDSQEEPGQQRVSRSGKLVVLMQLLEQLHLHTKERVVVVSNSTKTLDMIESALHAQQMTFLRLDGQTDAEARIRLVNMFNEKDSSTFVFLLSTKAGGVGLNLVGASRLVLYDIDWNPANDLQAMARVWRDGQKHTTYIYRLVSHGTIEEKVLQRQMMKSTVHGSVVQPGAGGKTSLQFSREELKNLFTLNETDTCDTWEMLMRSQEGGADTVAELHSMEHFGRPFPADRLASCFLDLESSLIMHIFYSKNRTSS